MRDYTASAHALERRKHPRFALRCPVHVSVHSGETFARVDAVSKNVSLSGLLLEATSIIPLHAPVSFVMTLQSEHIIHPIELAGEGTVVRVESGRSATEFLIALKCTRPLTQIEDCMSGRAN